MRGQTLSNSFSVVGILKWTCRDLQGSRTRAIDMQGRRGVFLGRR
jgi:hypothetical protein